MALGQQAVSNLMVPATGNPNAYVLAAQAFTATPFVVSFREISLNGLAFRPSGVIIDNTQSANPVTVLIPEFSFRMSCGAGRTLMLPYPAPIDHSASITGNGTSTIIFVDYPVFPFSF